MKQPPDDPTSWMEVPVGDTAYRTERAKLILRRYKLTPWGALCDWLVLLSVPTLVLILPFDKAPLLERIPTFLLWLFVMSESGRFLQRVFFLCLHYRWNSSPIPFEH